MEKSRNHKLLVVLAFGMILTFGILMNLRGTVNPLIREDYDISYSQLGLILMFFSGGSILATSSSGLLIEKFSLKQVLWAGLLVGGGGLIAISYTTDYYWLILVMFIVGTGLGVLNISANSLASQIFTTNKGRKMNIFHLFFGVGSFIAPVYAAQLFKLDLAWEATYSWGIILLVAIFLFSLSCKFPAEDSEDDSSDIAVTELLTDTRVILFVVMFLCHVGTELGISSWLGVYLDDVYNKSKVEISFYLSTFFALFTIGRLLASIIVERIGYLRLVMFSSAGALVSIVLGLVGPESFAIVLSVSGLFLAVNFPTMQAAMFEIFDENVSAILGLTLTAGGIGNVILANWFTGLLNDLLGIGLGFGIFIIYLLGLLGAAYYLKYEYLE